MRRMVSHVDDACRCIFLLSGIFAGEITFAIYFHCQGPVGVILHLPAPNMTIQKHLICKCLIVLTPLSTFRMKLESSLLISL